MLRAIALRSLALAFALLPLTGACESGTPQTTPAPAGPRPAATYDPDWRATQRTPRSGVTVHRPAPTVRRKVQQQPTAPIRPSPDDPLGGHFPLDQALAGLAPGPRLYATIRTSMGELTCELWPDRAPLTVANFVGLARGLRPWKTAAGTWVRRPAYDGTSFQRVIPGFAIQGGSPGGTLVDGPGYAIPDEIWEDAHHDRAGLLCMATTAKNTGGMQFFITDAPALHLDGRYPIFGQCGPVELIHAIASVAARQGRPVEPVAVDTVTIARGPRDRRAAPNL